MIMKIKKSHLKHIVQEEIKAALNKKGAKTQLREYYEDQYYDTTVSDAELLYRLLDGWTTSEEDQTISDVLMNDQYERPQMMAKLYDSFWSVLKRNEDTDDGDLIQWLSDDGLFTLSGYVSSQLRMHGYGPRRS